VDDERKVCGKSFQTRGPETASSMIYMSLFSFWAPSDLHVLLNDDNDGQCWQQPEHTFLSDKMELPRVDTCRQLYTACPLFADTNRQPVQVVTKCRCNVFIFPLPHDESSTCIQDWQHWSDERHCCSNLVSLQWAPEQESWLILLSVTPDCMKLPHVIEATLNYWHDTNTIR